MNENCHITYVTVQSPMWLISDRIARDQSTQTLDIGSKTTVWKNPDDTITNLYHFFARIMMLKLYGIKLVKNTNK